MKKRGMTLLLALLLLSSAMVGAAGLEVSDEEHDYIGVAAWAKKDIEKAMELGLAFSPTQEDVTLPICRKDFANNAAAVVALAYGQDLRTYEHFNQVQSWLGREDRPAWKVMGLLLGRENGHFDELSEITRQEAAVILARAYRLYAAEKKTIPEAALPYTDAANIANWAREDVALLTNLGVMNGVEKGRFDPNGKYTVQQCFVSVVRLYEKTAQGKEPVGTSPIQMTPRQEAISQAWKNWRYVAAAEKKDTIVIVYDFGPTPSGPNRTSVVVVDPDNHCKTYRNIIKRSHNTFWGEDESGQSDAKIDKVWLSEDGLTVYYKSTLNEDVYPYHPDGTYGELLFAKGEYTVALDVATGQQTYTREELPTA